MCVYNYLNFLRFNRTSCCIIVGMSIQGITEKFKGLLSNTEYCLTILVIVVSCTSFYLGRLSASGNASLPDNTQQEATIVQGSTTKADRKQGTYSTSTLDSVSEKVSPEGGYVASKSGTKYHLPWCGSAKQIKEENKIWFTTKEEAERAGYTPASNCKGI